MLLVSESSMTPNSMSTIEHGQAELALYVVVQSSFKSRWSRARFLQHCLFTHGYFEKLA